MNRLTRFIDRWLPEGNQIPSGQMSYLEAAPRRARVLIAFSLWAAIFSAFYATSLWFHGLSFLATACTLSVVGFLIPLQLLKKTGHLFFAGHLFMAVTTLNVITFWTHTGGALSHSLLWGMVVPFLASLLMGSRGALFWALVTGASAVGMYVLQSNGTVFLDDFVGVNDGLYQTLNLIGALVVATIYGFLHGKIHDESYEVIRKKTEQNTRLLQVLFHDVANPLSNLQLTAETQMDRVDQMDPNDAKAWERVLRTSLGIIEILGHVREMEKARPSADTQLHPVPVDEAVKKGTWAFQEVLEKKHLKLVTQKVGSHLILAEASSFQNQVLGNLIGNAIKFTPPGGIIEISSIEKGEHVEVSIADQGVGMPAEVRENLFLGGKTTTRLRTAGEKGTGYGMGLARSYLEQYGAEIRVESKTQEEDPENHGTTVTMIFRRAA